VQFLGSKNGPKIDSRVRPTIRAKLTYRDTLILFHAPTDAPTHSPRVL
jgi:hypothetical protein